MRGALIILYNKDTKILLQLRTADAAVYPQHWSFFGGNIEPGETPKEALEREAWEELNYKIKTPSLAVKMDQEKGKEHYYFIEKYDDQKLSLKEGEKMAWFTIEEAQKLKLAPSHKELLPEIEAKIKEREANSSFN